MVYYQWCLRFSYLSPGVNILIVLVLLNLSFSDTHYVLSIVLLCSYIQWNSFLTKSIVLSILYYADITLLCNTIEYNAHC